MAPCMGPMSSVLARSLWAGLCPEKLVKLREGTFSIGRAGGGCGPGLRRGGCLANFLQNGEGQTCSILNRARVTVFLARKELLHVSSILYIQPKLPVEINLNYLQVSTNLYIKKLSSPN